MECLTVSSPVPSLHVARRYPQFYQLTLTLRFLLQSCLMDPAELQLLRQALQQFQQVPPISEARFVEHEREDEDRHKIVTSDITGIKVEMASLKGYINGRAAVLGVVLAVAIPLLTVLASALLGHKP